MRLETQRGVLGVEQHGQGEPLVLLHPFPFDRRAFLALVPHLESTRRLITVEARGFGESPLAGDYAIADLADDVAAVLDALRLPRASVLGNSMGGYVALAFARRHAARLHRLFLCATRATADGEEARAARDAGIAKIEQDGAAAFVAGTEDRLLGPHASHELRDLVKELVDHPAPSLIAALRALRDRPDRSHELGAIEHETIVISGEHDSVTPPDDVRQIAERIRAARYFEIPDTGHLVPLEAPVQLAAIVNAY